MIFGAVFSHQNRARDRIVSNRVAPIGTGIFSISKMELVLAYVSPHQEILMPDPISIFLNREHQTLKPFFAPKTIAVIGASDRPLSVGRTLLENLLKTPHDRQIYPVNPHHPHLLQIPTYPTITAIPTPIDLAIVATPAPIVPDIIVQCVEAQAGGVLIISAGFGEIGDRGWELERQIRSIARGKLRVIGPNCLGIIAPHIGLNATVSRIQPQAGNLGFISQSGAISAAVLDWSLSENVGFSTFISLGSPLDVDWGDLLYYLGDDPLTQSIVIYLESIGNARSFLSAAREVALSKPIIAIRRQTSASGPIALSHAGRLVNSELALEAAFARCGIVEVKRIADLFNITEVLAKQPRLPKGPRLTILSNGAGPAILATDALLLTGGELAPLAPATIEKLTALLPPHPQPSNPIDLRRTADVDRYRQAFEIALADPHTDGVLVILTPRATTDAVNTAQAIAQAARNTRKTVLASWMGGEGISEGEAILNAHQIPTYRYPDSAASLFNLMWKYQYNLRGIYETPLLPSVAESFPDRLLVTAIIDNARQQNRTILSEAESTRLLAAYGIPVISMAIAHNESTAVTLAESIGYPVAIKLFSNTLIHKTEVGGVQLNITTASGVRQAYRSIATAVGEKVGPEHFLGVTVQKMINLESGYELLLGCTSDPRFGPILVFGMGGRFVEIFGDRSVALPPLNATLARRLMEGTKIYRALQGIQGRKPVYMANLEQLIVKFSQLVVEQAWIKAIDINPLLVDSEQAIALSASIVLHPHDTPLHRLSKPAIRPYPTQYISHWTTARGLPVTIRPIRAEYEPLLRKFYQSLSEQSIYFRYFHLVNLNRQSAYDRLTRICFIDYDRVMTLIADYYNHDTKEPEMLGLGRLSKLHGVNEAEFDLLISDAYQGHGLGTELLQRLVQIGRDEGLDRIRADILRENRSMQKVAEKAGFSLQQTGNSVKAEIEL
jgi:acetyltransferase